MENRHVVYLYLTTSLSLWFFFLGYSPNNTGSAQVRFFVGLPDTHLLSAARKRVLWVVQA